MDYKIIFLLIFIIITLFWLYLGFFYKKRVKKIEKWRFDYLKKRIKIASSSDNSFSEQIIQIDKIYHSILKEIWYSWTFWEILKQKPAFIDDIDRVWKLHKLRNKLAHDLDTVPQTILRKSSQEYKNEVNSLIDKF